MNVGKVIVRTSDFRLAYRLLAGLKARHVRCAHLERDTPLPPSALVWLATPEEVEAAADPLGIGAHRHCRQRPTVPSDPIWASEECRRPPSHRQRRQPQQRRKPRLRRKPRPPPEADARRT